MVNVDRVKNKLPSLLCDGPTTDRRFLAARHRIETGLKRLKKKHPEKYRLLELRLISVLEAFEKAVLEKKT